MAGSDGNGQGIHLSALDEFNGFVGVGEKLFAAQGSFKTVTVFFVTLHGLERTQAAEFAFDAHTDGMGDINHRTGDVDVVLEAGGSFGILFQGTIHHHAGETVADSRIASARTVPVVLVHDDGNVGIGLNCCEH